MDNQRKAMEMVAKGREKGEGTSRETEGEKID